MGILRVLICLFFPPLAVIDKGCGVLLLVCVLTLFGWIPGVLAALIICVQQQSTPQQKSRESSLGAVAFVIFLLVCVGVYVGLHNSSDHSSPSIAPPPKPSVSPGATIGNPSSSDHSSPSIAPPPKPSVSPGATMGNPSSPPSTPQTPRFATAAEAQQEAVRRYPDIGVAGTKLNTEFIARYKRYQQERPDFLRDPSWPLRLAWEIVPPGTAPTPPLVVDEIATLSGTKYQRVTITRVEPDGISISHSDGIAKIPFTDLSQELRTKYGYDPKKAAAYSQAEKAALVSYSITKRWSIPNGGEGKVIVIPPALANEAGMTAIANKLREDTREDRNAFVFIFDAPKAAEMRDRLNSLTPTELEFYQRHYMGTYMRNINSGIHDMELHPTGMNGPYKTLKF